MADVKLDILRTILTSHSESLVNHVLKWPFHSENLVITSVEAEWVASSCFNLQKLSITIARSRGNATEMVIYRSLGSLPQLQELFLTLDASYIAPGEEDEESGEMYYDTTHIPNGSSFNISDQRIFTWRGKVGGSWNRRRARIGHLRNRLINGALDETLGRSIFKAVSADKSIDALPLETLQVVSTGACTFDPNDRVGPKGI
jgi:hypothetical protein